jgi:hypothetical protein
MRAPRASSKVSDEYSSNMSGNHDRSEQENQSEEIARGPGVGVKEVNTGIWLVNWKCCRTPRLA